MLMTPPMDGIWYYVEAVAKMGSVERRIFYQARYSEGRAFAEFTHCDTVKLWNSLGDHKESWSIVVDMMEVDECYGHVRTLLTKRYGLREAMEDSDEEMEG